MNTSKGIIIMKQLSCFMAMNLLVLNAFACEAHDYMEAARHQQNQQQQKERKSSELAKPRSQADSKRGTRNRTADNNPVHNK